MKKFLFSFLILGLIIVPFVSNATVGGELSAILDRLTSLVGQLRQMAALGGATTGGTADFYLSNVVEDPKVPNFVTMKICNKGSASLTELGASLNLEVSSGSWSTDDKQVSSMAVAKDLKNGACATGAIRLTNQTLIANAVNSNQYYLNLIPVGFTDSYLQDNSFSFVLSGGVFIPRVASSRLNDGRDGLTVTVCNDSLDSKLADSNTDASGKPFYLVFTTGDNATDRQYDAFDMAKIGASGTIISPTQGGILTNYGKTDLKELGYGAKDGVVLKTCNDYKYLPAFNQLNTTYEATKKMSIAMIPKTDYIEPTLFDNIYLFNKNEGEKGAVVSNCPSLKKLGSGNKNTFLQTFDLMLNNKNLSGISSDTRDDFININERDLRELEKCENLDPSAKFLVLLLAKPCYELLRVASPGTPDGIAFSITEALGESRSYEVFILPDPISDTSTTPSDTILNKVSVSSLKIDKSKSTDDKEKCQRSGRTETCRYHLVSAGPCLPEANFKGDAWTVFREMAARKKMGCGTSITPIKSSVNNAGVLKKATGLMGAGGHLCSYVNRYGGKVMDNSPILGAKMKDSNVLDWFKSNKPTQHQLTDLYFWKRTFSGR